MCVFYPLNFKVSRLIAHAAGNRTDGNEARRKSITVACKFLLPFLKIFFDKFSAEKFTAEDWLGRRWSTPVARRARWTERRPTSGALQSLGF